MYFDRLFVKLPCYLSQFYLVINYANVILNVAHFYENYLYFIVR